MSRLLSCREAQRQFRIGGRRTCEPGAAGCSVDQDGSLTPPTPWQDCAARAINSSPVFPSHESTTITPRLRQRFDDNSQRECHWFGGVLVGAKPAQLVTL